MKTLRTSNAGYTMIELLVAMMLSGVALSVVATDFSHTVHQRHDMEQIAETQQAVKATMTFVTQELRQAGACLPALGNFIALDGANSGSRDSLTMRIGKITPDTMVCIRTVSTAAAVAGDSTIVVQDASGFQSGQYIYVTRAAGEGNTFSIASVGANSVTVAGVLDADYNVGSGVYAIEERTYSIDDSSGVPILTITIDDLDPMPLATGIDTLNVRYRLGDCVGCSSVDMPTSNSEWRVVREVELAVSAKTRSPLQHGDYHVVEESTTIKPRNLL